VEVIWGPLSDTASRTGTRSSLSGMWPQASWAAKSVSSRSQPFPSFSNAAMKAFSTWREVSSGENTVESQYLEITSMTAIHAQPFRAVKWVKS